MTQNDLLIYLSFHFFNMTIVGPTLNDLYQPICCFVRVPSGGLSSSLSNGFLYLTMALNTKQPICGNLTELTLPELEKEEETKDTITRGVTVEVFKCSSVQSSRSSGVFRS